jgi:tetratricopeptide (TPR) repeat protein
MVTSVPKARRAPPQWFWQLAAAALLALAVSAGTLRNGFVTDDTVQLLRNPLIIQPHSFVDLFRSGVWDFTGLQCNFYRPLQAVAYSVIYRLAGVNPVGYHLLIVLLHIANTCMVFWLARMILSRPAGSPRAAAWPIPVFAAALFAVHPAHTEVVNWVAALPDALMTFFVLSAVAWFARENGRPRPLAIAGISALYLGALFSKEPGVTLPALLAGFELLCQRRNFRGLLRNTPLYGAMSACAGLYLWARIHALGSAVPGTGAAFQFASCKYLFSAIVIAAQYLGKLVAPLRLSYCNPFTPPGTMGLSVGAGLLLIAALGALAVWLVLRFVRGGQGGAVCFGLLWMALTLAPVFNFNALGTYLFSERYLYLPSVGFCWAAAMAWGWWFARGRRFALATALVVLVAFSVRSLARNADWHDNLTLLEVSARQAPGQSYLYNMLANEYADRGDDEKATRSERLAVQFDPGGPLYHRNLGNLLLRRDPRGAIAEFEALVKLQPGVPDGYCLLGDAWAAAGDAQKAEAEYRRALQLKPDYSAALLDLSGICRDAGRIQEAISLCRRAAAAKPHDAEPYTKLAVLYDDTQQYAQAIEAARAAIEINPAGERAFLAHYELGVAYSHTQSLEPAAAEFAEAYRLRPDFAQAKEAYQNAMAELHQGSR